MIIIKRGLVAIVTLLVVVALLSLGVRQYLVQQRLGERPEIAPDTGVNESFATGIGGIKQWFHVRGQKRTNPVMLFLHGGPGEPQMPMANAFQYPVEEVLTVAHWDQRHAGKTGYANPRQGAYAATDFKLMLSDAIEVTEMLRSRYNKNKIVLMGHSWGTMLAHAMVMSRPDLFSAYVGVGVVIDVEKNEEVGLAKTIELARLKNDEAMLAILSSYSPDILSASVDNARFWQAMRHLREAQHRFGIGASRKYGDMFWQGARDVIGSPEYSLPELATLLNSDLPPQALLSDIRKFKAADLGTHFQMPVVYGLGRHDWVTPSVLAEHFLQRTATAPYKKVVWFEQSAHLPFEDEPAAVAAMLRDVVLPLLGGRPAAGSVH